MLKQIGSNGVIFEIVITKSPVISNVRRFAGTDKHSTDSIEQIQSPLVIPLVVVLNRFFIHQLVVVTFQQLLIFPARSHQNNYQQKTYTFLHNPDIKQATLQSLFLHHAKIEEKRKKEKGKRKKFSFRLISWLCMHTSFCPAYG